MKNNMIENKKYIAYGSNLNLKQMQYRCPTAKVIGTAIVENYELVFKGTKSGWYATIEPCKGMQVPVLIWETTAIDEQALDVYEGYPESYGKENMQVELNGETITAYVYTMPETYKYGMPTQRYIDVILEGYATAGFDSDILYNAIENTKQKMEEEPQSTFEMR